MPTTKIDEGLLRRLLQSSNRYDVSTIILVRHSKKNGGMIDVGEGKAGELEAILGDLKLHFGYFKEKGRDDYLIWHNNCFVPQTQKARQAMYRELAAGNRTQIGAKFLSIPECCNNAWDEEKGYKPYWRQLSKLYKEKGIEEITPFVGIKHAPCTITCEPTLNLRYGRFLEKNYPSVHLIELVKLRDMAKI